MFPPYAYDDAGDENGNRNDCDKENVHECGRVARDLKGGIVEGARVKGDSLSFYIIHIVDR